MKMLSACLLLLPFISCTQVQDTKNDAVIEQKIEALLSRCVSMPCSVWQWRSPAWASPC